jgi:hypothetical protein
MAIFQSKANAADPDVQVADFSYVPNDALAQLVIDAWVNPDIRAKLFDRQTAPEVFATRGFYWNNTLKHPVVISEADYHAGYWQQDEDEVVFVLPQHDGTCPPGQNLLDTAKLLMGLTPNGI